MGAQTDMMNDPKFPRGDTDTHKPAWRERKVMCGQPLLITAIQRIPFTWWADPLCLIGTQQLHCNSSACVFKAVLLCTCVLYVFAYVILHVLRDAWRCYWGPMGCKDTNTTSFSKHFSSMLTAVSLCVHLCVSFWIYKSECVCVCVESSERSVSWDMTLPL